ncbi:MAG: homoserine O-acetyltransferase [Planctomycetes bacterium]|nr:homoserine O-acetyltransferase [Planctomycetota bacterium]
MEEHLSNSVGIVETKTIHVVTAADPLKLQSGKTLGPIDVAYETYGELNEAQDNVVLICHALTGNAHAAGYNSPTEKKPGWWEIMIGPGKAIDTNKYFVICSNFLGGCSGTTGPSSINPETGKPYGLDFPIFTIGDMVNVQKLLLDKLGVEQLLCVIGGSMGGMQVLQWTIAYPDFVKSAVVAASTTRLSVQAIAFDAVGRNAIVADQGFAGGQYHDNQEPLRGLGIARMIGHITYLSEEGMHQKFGRELRNADEYNYDLKYEFSVEAYLDYQGQTFVERFDANSYIYITKAMDYFDVAGEYGSLEHAFNNSNSRFLVVSISSDWLFTAAQSKDILDALLACGKDVSYCNIHSPYGHDAFLLEPKTLGALVQGFLDTTHDPIGTSARNGDESATKKRHLKKQDYAKRTRVDYELISSLIDTGSTVLDVGCGDGELLSRLIAEKNVTGEGIELDQDLVIHCIERGISVIHRDIDEGLGEYATDSFDYAILSQTLQTVKEPEVVFKELLRIAKKVIVSFPNFGHWRCRLQLLLKGHAPRTKQLPFRWHNSPNIHCLTLEDFDNFCSELGVKVEKKIAISKSRKIPIKLAPNLLAEQAIYLTSKYEG